MRNVLNDIVLFPPQGTRWQPQTFTPSPEQMSRYLIFLLIFLVLDDNISHTVKNFLYTDSIYVH